MNIRTRTYRQSAGRIDCRAGGDAPQQVLDRAAAHRCAGDAGCRGGAVGPSRVHSVVPSAVLAWPVCAFRACALCHCWLPGAMTRSFRARRPNGPAAALRSTRPPATAVRTPARGSSPTRNVTVYPRVAVYPHATVYPPSRGSSPARNQAHSSRQCMYNTL